MKNRFCDISGILIFLSIIFPSDTFGQFQNTFTKTLYYVNGSLSPYHFDSLNVKPSGIAPVNDGRFYVLNMDHEQGYQTIYLIDSLGNVVTSYSGVGNSATLQFWYCYALKPTQVNGCVYIEHYHDFGGSPPVTNTYKLMELSPSGVATTLHTWNFPDAVTDIIPSYHNSYYCKLNGYYEEIPSGNVYPDSAIGLGPFVNDDFIYSNQNISRGTVNGAIGWTIPSEGFTAVAFSELCVYLVRDSLRKVDAASGTILWTRALPMTGNYFSLPYLNGMLISSGRDIIVIDSTGSIKGQNTINFTIDPPTIYEQLTDGSIASGGAFYGWSPHFRIYKRSGLVFRLNEEGHGAIDSTSVYLNGDADFDGILSFADDAVIIAAKLNEINTTPNLNFSYDYGNLTYGPDWAQSFESGLNLKFSDNNSDAVIDTNDFHILTNHSPITGGVPFIHIDSTGVPIYCKLVTDSTVNSDTLTYYIILGNQGEPIDSVYGISFTTGISGPVTYDYFDLQLRNGVIGDTATDLFQYSNYLNQPQRKSVVECRTDQQNITLAGGDTLAIVKNVFSSLSIPGIYPAHVYAHMIGKEGYTIPTYSVGDSVNLIINMAEENEFNNSITVSPNPATTELFINSKSFIKKISISDLIGRMVYSYPMYGNETRLNLSELRPGVYFLQCDFTVGRKVVKFIVGE